LEEFDEHTFSFIMALIGQNKHLPSVELLHGLDGWKVFILGHYLVGGFYTGDLYTLIADLPELTLLAEQLNAHAKISGNLLSSVKAVIFKDFP
jgi:hypothetical protein